MGLVLTIFSFTLSSLLVLIGNPFEVMPRYMQPLRHTLVSRVYKRWQVEYRVKRPFLRLAFLAAVFLVFWILVAVSFPIEPSMFLSRVALGLGLGGFLSWSLLKRRELLFGPMGIVGFYPNPRFVVDWRGLAGYLILPGKAPAIILVAKSGHWVESIPILSEQEGEQIELALLPYLSRLSQEEWPFPGLLPAERFFLAIHYFLLFMASSPLLTLLVLRKRTGIIAGDLFLVAAIGAAMLMPLYVFYEALKSHWRYYSSRGHVSMAHLSSLCQRCYYQGICWQSGLHEKARRQAALPSWEEFRQEFKNQPQISQEVYEACCRCLVSHLQAQDFYRVNLIPLRPLKGSDE